MDLGGVIHAANCVDFSRKFRRLAIAHLRNGRMLHEQGGDYKVFVSDACSETCYEFAIFD